MITTCNELIEALIEAGWKSPCDAQWTNIREKVWPMIDRRAKDAKWMVKCGCISEAECSTRAQCDARDEGWSCTQRAGHEGDHIACVIGAGVSSVHRQHIWPNEQANLATVKPVEGDGVKVLPTFHKWDDPQEVVDAINRLIDAINEMRKR